MQAFTARPPSAATGDTGASSVQSSLPSAVWLPADSTLIKHIPKSARESRTSHSAALLRKVVANCGKLHGWNFSTGTTRSCTHPSVAEGAKTIKDRISAYGAGHSDNDSTNPSQSAHQHRHSTTTLSQAIWKMAVSGRPFVFSSRALF